LCGICRSGAAKNALTRFFFYAKSLKLSSSLHKKNDARSRASTSRKVVLIPFFLSMALSSATLLLASDPMATNDAAMLDGIKQAAQEAAKLYLPRAAGRQKIFGFEPEDRLSSATLGTPVELYTLNDASVQAYHSGPIAALIEPTGQWLVPVTIGGTNRALIAVSQTDDGKWMGTTFGMAPLARKWQNIQGWWPAAEKFTPQLIIWPAAQGYFFSIPQVQPPNLTGLSDIPATHVDLQTTPKPRLVPAENSLTYLQEALKQTANPERENNTNKAKQP
jgi:hypothetical protein